MGVYVHGDNLEQKEKHLTKYRDEVSRRYLAEIRQQYNVWKNANLALHGPIKLESEDDFNIIEERRLREQITGDGYQSMQKIILKSRY